MPSAKDSSDIRYSVALEEVCAAITGSGAVILKSKICGLTLARNPTTTAVISPSITMTGTLEINNIFAELRKLSPPRASVPEVSRAEIATADIPHKNDAILSEKVPLLSIGRNM